MPALSRKTREAVRTAGQIVRAARLSRRMAQSELAERLGVSRYTVMAVERGDARVAIGTVLEAAAIVGVPLVAEGSGGEARALLRILPARARRPRLGDAF